MKIDRGSSIPSYVQIAEQLKAEILSGNLVPGSRLPAESELINSSKLSRITVRKGLELLVDEGWIVRKQGLGSFVRGAVDHNLGNVRTLNEILIAEGVTPKIKVLSFEITLPPTNVRSALKMSSNEKVLRIERLYSDGRDPMALVRIFLPLNVKEFADLLRNEKLPTESTYTMWEQRLGVHLKAATHTIRAGKAEASDARNLGLRTGDPILILDRVTYAEDGRPLEFLTFHYHWQRFQFTTTLPRITSVGK
jgi:GntR family transcriptional regulator